MFSFFHDIKGEGDAAAQLWLNVPAFQVLFYDGGGSGTLTFLLYHLNLSINSSFPTPVLIFIGKAALTGIPSVRLARRGGGGRK